MRFVLSLVCVAVCVSAVLCRALTGLALWLCCLPARLACSEEPLLPNDSDAGPGACSFGPRINLVNVNLDEAEVRECAPAAPAGCCTSQAAMPTTRAKLLKLQPACSRRLEMPAGMLRMACTVCLPSVCLQVALMCPTWHYDPYNPQFQPANLYEAQYERRMRLAAEPSANASQPIAAMAPGVIDS